MKQTAKHACTTMVVGKEAAMDHSVIIAHSDDDVSDERVIYVPARTYAQDSVRNVYYDTASLGLNAAYNGSELRRYVGKERGPGYNTGDYPDYTPIGAVQRSGLENLFSGIDPYASFAYFDSNYGIMNEKQLMIGECTCGAKVQPGPAPGKRLFYASELSRMALEYCTTARQAIVLIDFLIKEYGLYGTGETLLLGDTEEGWVIEMCAYEAYGSDGIWVAKRVPDDHYFVAANQFRIRDVPESASLTSPGEFLSSPDADLVCSANLFTVCKTNGWIDNDAEVLDWLPTVSNGEYAHPYYSLRRVWRAMSRVKPSHYFSPWVEDGFTREYPFSIRPDQKLSVADVAALYRDHYEGTEFDLTIGMAAGPFGNPARFEKNPDQGNTWNLKYYHPRGAWERPLSIYRCGMLWINQARTTVPEWIGDYKVPGTVRGKTYGDALGGISWIGLDRPAANCLMPFYVGINNLPPAMETMKLTEFDRSGSAWWAFNFTANYAGLKYSYMMKDITALQTQLEHDTFTLTRDFEMNILGSPGPLDPGTIKKKVTALCEETTHKVVGAWWKLADSLVVKYNNGCITEIQEQADGSAKEIVMEQIGYPDWWLAQTNYFEGPTHYDESGRYDGDISFE
jgi:dipeptidase